MAVSSGVASSQAMDFDMIEQRNRFTATTSAAGPELDDSAFFEDLSESSEESEDEATRAANNAQKMQKNLIE